MPFYGDPYTAVSAISDAGGIVLSRSSGYLPAFVQVSASAITATGTTRPFETLEYTWDFGDPSGTESLVNPADGGATVNPNTSQVGPEAAYVYRTAGTYTITLTIRGYTGSGYVTETVQATFTASAFPADENWYFDSVSGNNANDGLTSGTAKENLTGFSFWPTEDAYVHYHFARGGTYTYALGNRGITRFSAYGSGAKPILNFSGTGFLLNVTNNEQVFEDVVMSDIHIVTSGENAMRLGVAGGLTNSGINDIYLDNVKITRNAPAEDHDYACFQLSGSTVGVGYWNVEMDTGTNYIGAEYLGGGGSWRFFMGCQFLNGRGYTAGPGRQTGHNIYMGSENHQLVRYCELGTGAGGRYFNINMDSNLAAGVVVQYYNISDCELTGFYSHIDMSNTNNDRSTNAVMDDIVVDRCWFHDPETVWGSVASVFSYSSDDSTFRENLFEDVATPTTIFYFPDTAARPRIYDNTMPYDPTLPSGGGGFETNNTADNQVTFGGNTSGAGNENGGAITGTLTASDAVDGMTTPNFTVTVAATNGEASINSSTGSWSYTPDADYFGSDVFTVRVTDDLGNHDTQVITITVNEVGGSAPTYYAFSAGGLTYVFQTGGA